MLTLMGGVLPSVLWLSLINAVLAPLGKYGSISDVLRNTERVNLNLYIRRKFVYSQIRIITTIANDIVFYFSPAVLLVAMTSSVLLLAITMTMRKIAPIPVYIAVVFLLTAILLASMGLLPYAVNIEEYSRSARRYWECKGRELPLVVRKDVASWRVISLEIGPFFKVKRSTPTTFLWFTINSTISLVLFLKSQAAIKGLL